MKYTADELESAISQYIDGTLGPLEQAALEEVLATDESARATLAEFRKLDSALKTNLPVAQVDQDALEARITGALSQLDAPVRHFKLSPMTMRIVAIAASVVIIVGTAILMLSRKDAGTGGSEVVVNGNFPNRTAPLVAGPSAERGGAAAGVRGVFLRGPPRRSGDR